MKQTSHESMKVVHMLDAASYGAAAEGFSTSVDCKGFREMQIAVNFGVVTATGDVTFQAEESDDDSTWTDITDAAIAEKTVTNDQKTWVGHIDLTKRKRYIRMGYDVDDDAAILSIDAILSAPYDLPTSPQNTIAFNV